MYIESFFTIFGQCINVLNYNDYYSTVMSFYNLVRKKEHAKYPSILHNTVLHLSVLF